MTRRERRAYLMEKQAGLCFYCDAPMTKLGPRMFTVEHVIPVPEGGERDETNEVGACHQCNRMKGCMTVDQIRKLADRIEVAILALSDGEARG